MPDHRRRSRRPVRVAMTATAIAIALGGAAAIAAPAIQRARADRAVARALNAGEVTTRRAAACARRQRAPKLELAAGSPSRAVLDELGVLRRPATAADRIPSARLALGAGTVVLRDSIRVAKAADGTRFLLYVSRGAMRVPGARRDPVACARAVRRAALVSASASAASVRARVARFEAARLARAERLAAATGETLTVMRLRPDGRVLGGGTTALRAGRPPPAMGTVGTARIAGRRRVILTGVVPDIVRSIRILDRDGPPARRPGPVTVEVTDNVYVAVLPRRMGPRMTVEWRTPFETVVRRVHPRH